MSTLWQSVLPVIQDINDYGGNFISIFVNRAVIDEIDRLTDGGDQAMASARRDLKKKASALKGPADHAGFNGFFECYHEALFYILAMRRGVQLRPIPETTRKTPDFEALGAPPEAFEIKTIDFSGGPYAYGPIMEGGLDQRIETAERAQRSGVASGCREIAPHGNAANTFEAIARVMRQIAGNVKEGQFESHPTFLVVPMARTALRTGPAELQAMYFNDVLGGDVSGHLWTIAAHDCGAAFFDATPDEDAHDMGPLQQAGILIDFPFIAGICFINVTWNHLPSSDSARPFPDEAFRLHGVWNGSYKSPAGVSRSAQASAFTQLCDDFASM